MEGISDKVKRITYLAALIFTIDFTYRNIMYTINTAVIILKRRISTVDHKRWAVPRATLAIAVSARGNDVGDCGAVKVDSKQALSKALTRKWG